jgi:hypothetical protein
MVKIAHYTYLCYNELMKAPDPVKERSEMRVTLVDFLKMYNDGLPDSFPTATKPYLREFQKAYPGLFDEANDWSLEQHRKKVMDWLPQHIRSLEL